MEFAALVEGLAVAAAAGDGDRVAALFTPQGVYHDVFYGAFRGREKIREMIEEYFHRDAENFLWDMHDPVRQGDLGYARYVFSFDSKLPEARGRRAMFEGVCIARLDNGLIREYREVANVGTGFVLLGFEPQRTAKILGREASQLRARPESAAHVRD